MRDAAVKVIVTTHNRRLWAQAAVESVLAQTHRAFHVVIVDDSSNDGTAELARAFACSHPQQVSAIMKPQNLGLADSIRQGLLAPPSAPYVAILNDDDEWRPTKLERQLALFQVDPSLGLVYCEAEVFDKDGRLTGELFSDIFKPDVPTFDSLFNRNWACASSLIFRQDLAMIAARTLPEPSMVTDHYLMMLAAGYSSVGVVDEPLALYRMTPGAMSTHDAAMARDGTRAHLELFARNPALVERVGGPRRARRKVALSILDVAVLQLEHRQWREFFWHSVALLRTRSLRPTIWLGIHAVRRLVLRRKRVPTQ